ncbi:MAG TPA: phosphatase PAP2 family protein [bacterium]|nr:phosphatase PAP2 family protein [bacterium]
MNPEIKACPLCAGPVRRYHAIGLEPMDWVILIYFALTGLLLIPFHNDVPRWPLYPAGHFLIVVLLLELIRWNQRKDLAVLRAVRTFYPLLFVSLGWKELDNLITMIFPYWANEWVIKLDLLIFGQHPTVWVQSLFRPWLTELMNFFYASFWLFIPLGAFSLYFKGKRKETFDFLFFTVLAYAVSFFMFLLFPSEGAWVILKDKHTVDPDGGFFLSLNQWVQSKGTIRGGAIPSSHVTAAFTMTWACFYQRRRLGWLFLFLSVGTALATVYCRYHHAVDPIAGILCGTVLFFIGKGILGRRNRRRPGTETEN